MPSIQILIILAQFIIIVHSDYIQDYLARWNYPCDLYGVETEDGYRLTVHRILPKANRTNVEVAILMHGLTGSAADLSIAGKGYGLAEMLHDQGFDVWMGNARGSTYSKGHRNLSIESAEFWNFTWHEIGAYDIPAIVNMVIRKTKKKKLHYVGHSQGTTTFFVMLAMRPEYNEKFASVNLMAPVAYLQYLSSPLLRIFSLDTDGLQSLLEELKLYEILSDNTLLKDILKIFCGRNQPTQDLCILFTYAGIGFSTYPIDKKLFGDVFDTIPAGISYKQLAHFGQLVTAGKFQQFDYRSKEANIRQYGTPTPPLYNWKNVKIPMNLYVGSTDLLTARQDVNKLMDSIKHTKSKMTIIDGFNHIDFLFCRWANKILYKKIIYNIQKSASAKIL